ncbi:MAG: hypothetical protein WC518_02550 [Patescibacteria group bacterium]
MKKFFILGAILLSFVLGGAASAHQPRLIYNLSPTLDKPLDIFNPEVSQAFYAQLKGDPEYFRIILDQPLEFYFQILVPAVKDVKKNVSAELKRTDLESQNFVLDGSGYDWQIFHEEFAGDDYWQGPEKKIQLPAGDYLIKTYSADNFGKYVLVVGQAEAFPPDEAARTLINLPVLKYYFNKPLWAIFEGKVGHWLASGLIGLIIIVVLMMTLIRRLWRR